MHSIASSTSTNVIRFFFFFSLDVGTGLTELEESTGSEKTRLSDDNYYIKNGGQKLSIDEHFRYQGSIIHD